MNRLRLQRRLPYSFFVVYRFQLRNVKRLSWLCLACTLFGCTPDDTPLKAENQRLKKQIERQETIIASLQEGNKLLQEQIDRLHQEARAQQQQFEETLRASQARVDQLTQGTQAETQQLKELERQNQKLKADLRWLRRQRDQLRQGMKIFVPLERPIVIPHPLSRVLSAVETTLRQNGYALLAEMLTDQKAVLVTKRKTSPAASLEIPGFRNQFLVTLEQDTNRSTKLWIIAEFEKLMSNGVMIQPTTQEVKEVQLRLAQEIQRAVQASGKVKPAAQP
ncbi:MAG: hypothetical protein D6690_00570 [Nitrospirae bacterium]|nr:MAG: hypothetical protein D6690_00570 [Nitrospirota bacterium]